MADTAFVPTIFTKHGCPFCLKLRLFLLEAGLLDTVSLIEGETTEAHQKLAEQLSDHLEKPSFQKIYRELMEMKKTAA